MKNKTKKIIKKTLGVFFILILLLLFVRIFSSREIDDISPEIECKEKYFNQADVLWVIPEYNGIAISENKIWCQKILNTNKTLGLHGIKHPYKEFGKEISEEEILNAIRIFEECFNQTPRIFKAPQLELTKENKKTLEKNGLRMKGKFNQIIHRVYHCEDKNKISYGLIPNWMVDLF
jgi:predicted deacetylase